MTTALFVLTVALLTVTAISMDMLDARSAGRSSALLGVLTIVLVVALGYLSFSSWNPPTWSRIMIAVGPFLTWPATLVLGLVGRRRNQRAATIGLACSLATAIAIIAMINAAY